MTKEDKKLLIKDICARLPYGVKGLHRGEVHELFTIDGREINSACIQVDDYDAWFPVETFKPYLRLMSNMTHDEDVEYRDIMESGHYILPSQEYASIIDWLNEHHFDYRDLIYRGLALEAPEGMYTTE
jgi:hypothetical protein